MEYNQQHFLFYRHPINHDHLDDFLTKPWFILLLGSILAIMMLSFGAMVFVKRKHMLMKQGALNGITGKVHFHLILHFTYYFSKQHISFHHDHLLFIIIILYLLTVTVTPYKFVHQKSRNDISRHMMIANWNCENFILL